MKYENKNFIYDRPIKCTLKFVIKRFLIIIYSFFIKVAMNLFHPHMDATPKKYKVSICAIFKNEAKYLKEWIEFHKIIGVQHFFMYNNFSTDNYLSVLKPYIEAGYVDLIEWPVPQGQMLAYKDCIEKYSTLTEWIGFIDIDEFVVPIKSDSIVSFLDRFYKNRPAVLIYWKMFGTSGRLTRSENSLIIEDFTISWNKYVNIGKCFINTRYNLYEKGKTFHHSLWTKFLFFKFPPVNIFDKVCIGTWNPVKNTDSFPLQINHYLLKSFSEYQEKVSKGDVFFKQNPHTDMYFSHHEQLCCNSDVTAYKYLIKLKCAITNNNISINNQKDL